MHCDICDALVDSLNNNGSIKYIASQKRFEVTCSECSQEIGEAVKAYPDDEEQEEDEEDGNTD